MKAKTDSYEQIWTNWKDMILAVAGSTAKHYNVKTGVNDDELSKLQTQFDFEFDMDFIFFYRAGDVEYDGVASTFCFELPSGTYDLIPFKHIYSEWQALQDLDGDEFEVDYTLVSERLKIKSYVNSRWLPIAENREGDYLLVDCDPSPKGIRGQIVELQNESWERNVVADSIEDLVNQQVERLKSGKYSDYIFTPSKPNTSKARIFQLMRLKELPAIENSPRTALAIAEFSQQNSDCYFLVRKDPLQDQTLDLDLDHIVEEPLEYCVEKPHSVSSLNIYHQVLIFANVKIRNIFNENTDGSGGLYVNGSCEAENIVVGGNEIVVAGDLSVSNVFWGDYNHGGLEVAGEIKVKVFVETDEYHFNFEKNNLTAQYTFSDYLETTGDEIFDSQLICSVFKPEFTISQSDADEGFGWREHLNRSACLVALRAGQALIQSEIVVKTIASTRDEMVANRYRIFAETLFLERKDFENQRNNLERIAKILTENPEGNGHVVILNHYLFWKIEPDPSAAADRFSEVSLVFTHRTDDSQIVFSMISGKKNKLDPLYVLCKGPNEKRFKNLFKIKGENAKTAAQDLWSELTYSIECGLHFRNLLSDSSNIKKTQSILSLPIVKDKNKNYSSENPDETGFWHGNRYYSFNYPGENSWPGMISVALENSRLPEKSSNNDDCRRYYFWLDDLSKPKEIKLRFLSSENNLTKDRYSENSEIVSILDWKIFREAIEIWPRIESDIKSANESFISDRKNAQRHALKLQILEITF